ncbi:helicase HerA-like domain-containing protein, partial [Neisseria sp. P0018.S006]|uniref:helicase HerA-like domain-containing protein n=1 Tax=Neisseria sp. P0018.S006 TaxID=3436792 RepID=UPI003F8186C5
RFTISEMGPMLLARLMNLNYTQEGLLSLVFKVAYDRCLHILDVKDLRSMLKHVSDHASEYRTQYGNVSAASIGAIQRQLLTLENEGAEKFGGEPSLNLQDWMQTDNGKGISNILNSEKLMRSPRRYSACVRGRLAELVEILPEVGD